MHGKTDMIHHDDRGLFEGLPNPFEATRYHSLVIQPDTLSDEFEVCAWSHAPDGTLEIMGIRHKRLPLFGVQFHPGEFSDRLRHEDPRAVPGGDVTVQSSAMHEAEKKSRIVRRIAVPGPLIPCAERL